MTPFFSQSENRLTAPAFTLIFSLTLAACGGGGGSSDSGNDTGGVFDKEAAVDADSTPQAAQSAQEALNATAQSTDSFAYLAGSNSKQRSRFHATGFAVTQLGRIFRGFLGQAQELPICPGGGKATLQESGAKVHVTFDNCVDALGDTTNGRLTLTLLSDDEGHPVWTFAVAVEFVDFTVTSAGVSETLNAKFNLAGTLTYGDVDVTLKGWLTYKEGSNYLALKDLNMSLVAESGVWETTISHLKVGSTALGGYVNVKTIKAVSGTSSSTCPTSGVVEVTGDGSTLLVRYGSDAAAPNAVTLEIDGIIESFADCTAFENAV